MNEIVLFEGSIADVSPASITFDKAHAESVVQGVLEEYGVHDVSACDVKDLKRIRAHLNKILESCEKGRKFIKAESQKPYSMFEADIKDVEAPLKAEISKISERISSVEAEQRRERIERLRDAYFEFAPIMAEAIPFETLFEAKWANASFGEKKAEEAMMQKASKVAEDFETLKTMKLAFPAEAKAVFARTLSLRSVRENDEMRAEEAERIKALDAFKPSDEYEYSLVIRCTEAQFEQVRAFVESIGAERISAKRRPA